MSYALGPGVALHARGADALVVSERPLQALRVNATALALLRRCDGHTPLKDVAAAVGLDAEAAQLFLDTLMKQGLVLRRPAPPAEWPSVSIVVPVRNRAADVRECVASLLALDYPPGRVDIIVVDDASEDGTAEAVAHLPVRIIRQDRQLGPAACRNAGAHMAQGEFLAFTDSDCVVDPDWLTALLPHFDDAQVGAVGGLVAAYRLSSAIDRYEAAHASVYMGLSEGEVHPNSRIPFLPTANLLVRKAVWERIGGFDEAFPIGEDVDFVWRVRDAGYRVQYVPRGRVRHKYRSTLRAYVSRRAFYGGSETFLLRKHTDKPKALVFTWPKLASIVALVAGMLSGRYELAALGAGVALLILALRAMRARSFGTPLSLLWVARALARDYAAFFYHICGNFGRYYSIPFLLLGLLYRPLLLVALLALLYPAVHDFVSRRPRLSFPAFLVLYWLELLAHQVGMLVRCWERGAFGVLVPRMVIRKGIDRVW